MVSPFEVLGIHPFILSVLDDQQMKELVKRLGKALQLVYHSDRSTSDSKHSSRINVALASLESTEKIKKERIIYLQTGPGQRELKEALDEFEQARLSYVILEQNIKNNQLTIDSLSGLFSDKITTFHKALLESINGIGDAYIIDLGLKLRYASGLEFVLAEEGDVLNRIH